MNTPRRILLIASGPGLAGGERNLLDIAEHLVADGSRHVAAVVPAAGPLKDKLEGLGCRVEVAPLTGLPRVSSILAIKRLIRAEKIDVVHAHGTRAAFYARPAARLAGVPCVYTVHGIHYLHYSPVKRAVFLFVERLMRRWQARVIFVCRADKEKGIAEGIADKAASVVIYNGVRDTASPPPRKREVVREELAIAADRELVLCVGRFHLQKGQIYLARAAGEIAKRRPQALIAFVGDGDTLAEVRREVERLGMGKNVAFLGWRQDARDVMAAADVFALPSLWEGLPYALLEACLMALPIVATSVDGNPEVIIDGETGLLVPPEDPQAMAEAILKLLDDKELAGRLAQQGRRHVEANFTVEEMCRKTVELYGRAVRGPRTESREP